MRNKPFDKSKIDELIELAKIPLPEDKDKKKFSKQPVKYFMESDGLHIGNDFIPAFLIYDRYLNWAELNKISTPLTLVMFFKEFSLYAEKKRGIEGTYYKVNVSGFNLTPEYAELVKRKQKSGKKKKRKKT